jgi:hypothetical protein
MTERKDVEAHLVMRVSRHPDGRLTGEVGPDGGSFYSFSGTLELLNALESLVGTRGDGEAPAGRTPTLHETTPPESDGG